MAPTPYYGAIYRGTNAERTGGTWTTLAAGWIYIETDTQAMYYWDGTSWLALGGAAGSVTATSTTTFTNKTVNPANNTIADTTPAAGDLLKGNGTKYVQLGRGSANQVLQVNSGGTDVAWASLQSERTGKSTASGNGSTTVFTIAHGLGSNPTYTFVTCSSHTIGTSYTTDATNITVTFASAPGSGTNNVIIFWRVIA